MHSHDISQGGFSAEMHLPGDPGDPLLATKMEHIQEGVPAGSNPLTPSATPARKVLATDEMDLEGLLVSLAEYIVVSVGMAGGASTATVSGSPGGRRRRTVSL
jgi:hypothetical protein